MNSWYVAKCKARKESWLIVSLRQLGVEVYYPMLKVRRRGKTAQEPLFPSYLFCSFDPETVNWPAVRWAPGLDYFLGAEGRPTPISDSVVGCVRNSGTSAPASPMAGEAVTIAGGPLAGLVGIFQQHIPSRQRCRILLNVVGKLSPVEISESNLVPGGVL